MPYIKDVLIDVIEDVSVKESSTTTDHALEDGEQITDHVKADPITVTIKGLFLDDNGRGEGINDSEGRVASLRKYREEGEIIDFNYVTGLEHCVIINFDRDYSAKIKDGFAFTMTLKQIKTAKVSRYVAVQLPVKKQTKPVAKKGRQQPKKTKKAAAKTTKKKYTQPPVPSPAKLGTANLDKSKYFNTPTYGGWSGLEGRK